MRTAPTLTRVSIVMALAAAPAFAAQHGHQTQTPHGTTQTSRQPHTTSTTTTGSTNTSTTSTSTSTSTTSTTTPTTTTNPIATRISRNPQLAGRITHMLQPSGMSLDTASNGFRNQGQFIAAVHVSQNLHIPFTDLKNAMTGPQAMSLGQAIHTLRPSANATDAVRRANTQTQSDLR